MTRILKLNVLFGCSILIKYYCIFIDLLLNDIVDTIYVSIDKPCLEHYRGSNEDYYKNYVDFLTYINEHPQIIVEKTYNSEYKCLDMHQLSIMYSISTKVQFILIPRLISNSIPFTDPYITVSTKILGISKKLYDGFKDEFIDRLNKMNMKIVLLGERNISECNEYQIHETYSIYDDLIKGLHNYEDYTIKDNTENNTLMPFLQSCGIFNKSKLNIFIGNGGVSEILCYTSVNILGFTHKENLFDTNNYLHGCLKNIQMFHEHRPFLERITINSID